MKNRRAEGYREFIQAELDSERFGRGGRSRLAEYLGIQSSHVSLVLTGRQDFQLEHVLRTADFLDLNEEEKEWLVLLANRDRAGTSELKRHYQKQIDRILQKRNEIQSRVRTRTELSEEVLNEYYSAWYHIAVHMALRNPECRTNETLARFLKLGVEQVSQSLKVLEKIGFAKAVKGQWQPVESRIHVTPDQKALRTHHLNWRIAAMRALDRSSQTNLHYSVVMSIDAECAEKIRALILESIEKMEPAIRDARDEQVHALSLDFYPISRI